MKKVRISIFGKEYELVSESPDEAIDYVYKRLKELQANYKSLHQEISFDELLVVMLCDVIESEFLTNRRFAELIQKLKEKIKSLEGEVRR